MRVKGSVTVFLSLALILVIALVGSLLESARVTVAREIALDNSYFNGEDIQNFFDLYNIQTEGLFNFNKENDSITFNSKDNKENDFTEFFRNLFLYSNIMDGMPYQYLAKKYNLEKID